ncbi:hypothetical protein BDZ91DRAFT_718876 [Kalaharituber pfeilii]|nr:hypothetical protein BDZ91DRAFT_718876 [Kalaharituber pfeilii]
MGAATALDFDILESPLFKLTLADGQEAAENGSRTTFYIHRDLLASLSPELRKHIDNEMKEGLSGEMLLHDVDKDTLRRFLQWAYVKEYTPCFGPKDTMFLHAKLYAFAERFNITSLKDLSFEKFTSLLTKRLFNPDPRLSTDVLSVARFAIDNLPALTERLVEYLLASIAWMLDDVRGLTDFADLIHAHPDAAVAIFHLARPAQKPPVQPPSSGPTGKNAPSSVAFIETCDGCGQNAIIATICCRACDFGWDSSSWVEAHRQKRMCKNQACLSIGALRYHCGRNKADCISPSWWKRKYLE